MGMAPGGQLRAETDGDWGSIVADWADWSGAWGIAPNSRVKKKQSYTSPEAIFQKVLDAGIATASRRSPTELVDVLFAFQQELEVQSMVRNL